MILKDNLSNNYECNEPIFINDINIEGMSKNAVRQSMKRLTETGYLKKYENGIYYIPKSNNISGFNSLDSLRIIQAKYINNDTDTFGYVTGIYFANQLGLTTQMSATIEIVTNNEVTNRRNVTIANQKVRIKRSNIKISSENADILQLLDGINQADKYSELSREETINRYTSYIKEKNFSKKQLSKVSNLLTGKTAKRLIEWGIIYAFI